MVCEWTDGLVDEWKDGWIDKQRGWCVGSFKSEAPHSQTLRGAQT